MIMGTAQTNPAGPDLTQGVPVDRLTDGRMLAGHVGEEPVLVVRRGDDLFAVGAPCTHYGGPLSAGAGGGRTPRRPSPPPPFPPQHPQPPPPPALLPPL